MPADSPRPTPPSSRAATIVEPDDVAVRRGMVEVIELLSQHEPSRGSGSGSRPRFTIASASHSASELPTRAASVVPYDRALPVPAASSSAMPCRRARSAPLQRSPLPHPATSIDSPTASAGAAPPNATAAPKRVYTAARVKPPAQGNKKGRGGEAGAASAAAAPTFHVASQDGDAKALAMTYAAPGGSAWSGGPSASAVRALEAVATGVRHARSLRDTSSQPTARLTKSSTFTFDHCFLPAQGGDDDGAAVADAPASSQAALFEEIGKPTVEHVVAGGHASVIAFGGSGTGKTFSILGPGPRPSAPPSLISLMRDPDRGLLLRASAYMFDVLQQRPAPAGTVVTVSVSVYEVYQDRVRCLLGDPAPATARGRAGAGHAQHPGTRSPFADGDAVHGVTWAVVANYADAVSKLALGNGRRRTQSGAHHRSSRSHAVFSVRVEHRRGEELTATATMSFVDLAGSERVGAGAGTSEWVAEARSINKSLLVLGRVIDALSAATPSTAPPFRDSTLTKALWPHLVDADTRTVLLGTVSSAAGSVDQNRKTLQYASRSREIVTAVAQRASPSPPETVQSRCCGLTRQLTAPSRAAARSLADGTASAPVAGAAAEIRELRRRLEAVEARDAAAPAGSASSDVWAVIQQIEGRLGALEARGAAGSE